jgi:outer membrane receptor protein involved in Fe transport
MWARPQLGKGTRTVHLGRLQAVVDGADDLRVRGSYGQPEGMPELAELRQYRRLLGFSATRREATEIAGNTALRAAKAFDTCVALGHTG